MSTRPHNIVARLATSAVLTAATALAGLLALSAGCGGNSAGQPAPGNGPAGAGAAGGPDTQPFVRIFQPPNQSGAQIWAANCNRCHYAASPTDFSPREWDLIVQHMRLRANLTGEEARKVAEFLRAGS